MKFINCCIYRLEPTQRGRRLLFSWFHQTGPQTHKSYKQNQWWTAFLGPISVTPWCHFVEKLRFLEWKRVYKTSYEGCRFCLRSENFFLTRGRGSTLPPSRSRQPTPTQTSSHELLLFQLSTISLEEQMVRKMFCSLTAHAGGYLKMEVTQTRRLGCRSGAFLISHVWQEAIVFEPDVRKGWGGVCVRNCLAPQNNSSQIKTWCETIKCDTTVLPARQRPRFPSSLHHSSLVILACRDG